MVIKVSYFDRRLTGRRRASSVNIFTKTSSLKPLTNAKHNISVINQMPKQLPLLIMGFFRCFYLKITSVQIKIPSFLKHCY